MRALDTRFKLSEMGLGSGDDGFWSPTLATAALSIGLCLGAAGCRPGDRQVEHPGPKIVEVEIESCGELNQGEVLEHIALRPSKWLGERYDYFPGRELVSRERLTQYFRSEGYYDVEVEPIQVHIHGQGKPIARQRAKVRIRVIPHRPTRIYRIDWEIRKPSLPRRTSLIPGIAASSQLKRGQRFSVSAFNRAKELAVAHMQSLGYAYAKVTEEAQVDTSSYRATLKFTLDFGPLVRVRALEVLGIDGAPKRMIERIAASALDRIYSPQLLDGIQAKIQEQGIYGSVHVALREMSKPSQARLEIRVQPSDPSQLALGAIAHFDATLWSQQLGLRYQHKNLFSDLVKLNLHGAAGWAEMPVRSGTWHSSPIFQVDAHLSKPSIKVRGLGFFVEAESSAEPREGFEFWRAEAKFGVAYSLRDNASLALSYNASWLSIYTFSSRREDTTSEVARIEGDRPFLSFLEVQAQVFDLDRQLAPTQGIHALMTYQWASRFLGSQSEYHRWVPELRGYLSPLPGFVIASRLRLGLLLPFGQRPGARLDQRFYLGGVDSVRGWPLRSMSPFWTLCDDEGTCSQVPYGGNTKFLANLEFRFRVWKTLDLVAFFDTGDVQREAFRISPRDWMYTSGPGLRYVTAIGAIRLDLGIQLNRDRVRFRSTKGYAVHFSLGDSF